MKTEQEQNAGQGWVRKDELSTVRRMSDWVNQVQSSNRWYLTDFLTPREQFLMQSVAKREGFILDVFGGFPRSERKRGIIMPGDWYPKESDYEIEWLHLIGTSGFSHGSILGSLLGLGLDRRVIGDIVFTRDGAHVSTESSIARFIAESLHHIGRDSVSVELNGFVNISEIMDTPMIERTIFVSSLRIDAVLAQSCNWPRSRAKALIEKGLLTLNHSPLTDNDTMLFIGDILSIRHFGRVKVIEVAGTTKKDRVRVNVGILKSK